MKEKKLFSLKLKKKKNQKQKHWNKWNSSGRMKEIGNSSGFNTTIIRQNTTISNNNKSNRLYSQLPYSIFMSIDCMQIRLPKSFKAPCELLPVIDSCLVVHVWFYKQTLFFFRNHTVIFYSWEKDLIEQKHYFTEKRQ